MLANWIRYTVAGAIITGCAAELGDEPESPAALPGAVTVAAAQPELQELLAVDWELAPGTEKFLCTRKTLTETDYASAIGPVAPTGTHHVLLSIGDKPDAADGTRECDAAETFPRSLGGGGVGTQRRDLPEGVAIALMAGQQLLINTHLFNVSDQPLRGHSGVLYRPMAASAVRELADSTVMGPTKLQVPPGRSTVVGGCTIARDARYFGIMPHMHQTGVALKAVAHSRALGDVVLYDGAYDFDSQIIYPMQVDLAAGDYVEVACTYDNPRDRTLHWGQSSTDEMCQIGMGRRPAGGPSICNR